MGGYFSSNAAYRTSEDVLLELESTRIERELAISQILEHRKQIYELAREREKLNWTASGGMLTAVLSALSSYHHRNLIHLLPLFPIVTFIGYQAHYCYGDKNSVLKSMSSSLLENEQDSVDSDTITLADVRKRMDEMKTNKFVDEF